jgi:hypothetical protein
VERQLPLGRIVAGGYRHARPALVEVIESCAIAPGRTLEIGGGTGTNAINAIEPALEIVQLRSTEFTVCQEQLKSWLCLSRQRAMAAQRSTRR